MNTKFPTFTPTLLRTWGFALATFLACAATVMAQGPGKIAYVADSDIWMMEADGSGKEALGLAATDFNAYDVQLSPSGEWLVFNGIDWNTTESGLFLMRAEAFSDPDNFPVLIGPDASIFKRASWHPAGGWVAYVGNDNKVYLVEALDGSGELAGGVPETITDNASLVWCTDVAFAPDGRNLLVCQFEADLALIEVFDANGARTTNLIGNPLPSLTTQFVGRATWPSFSADGKKIAFQSIKQYTGTLPGSNPPENGFITEVAIATLTIRDNAGTLTPEHHTTNPRQYLSKPIYFIIPPMFVDKTPTWSRDGSKIVFVDYVDGSPSDYKRIVSLNTTTPEHDTNNPRVVLAGDDTTDVDFPSFAHPGNGISSTPATPAPVPPNLISWWPGENAAWDVAGIGEGSMKNSATEDPYDVGKVGRAFWFDGIDDHVQGSAGLSLTGDFTIEVWVKPEAHSAEAVIVAKGDTADDDVSYSLLLRNGKPWFRSSMGGIEQEIEVGNVTYSLPLGQWTHLAFTQNAAASRMTFYVNGVLMQQTAAVPPRPDTNGPLTIGAAIDATHPTATPASPYEGLVDELTLYDRALSGTEIQLIVNAGKEGKERHDPARDFSPAANPNGLWHYGWIDGLGSPVPSNLNAGDPNIGGLFPTPAVLEDTVYVYGSELGAHLLFNKSKTDRASIGMTQNNLSPRQFALHPALGGDMDYSVLQWVAPKSGRYALSATFTGVEDSPTSTEVFLYRGGTSLFGGTVGSFLGDGVSATREVVLNEDDNVTWLVGPGSAVGLDYTGLVASAVLLEESQPFLKPTIERIDFTAPMMDGKTVKFFVRNGDRSANPTMSAKIQYSVTPGVPGSWIDLPGGTMSPSGNLSFIHTTSTLPVGTYAFRVATTVAGLGTTFSTPSDTYTVLAAAPYYEVELDVSSASDPSGVTTHRGDTIDYTVRFRNSGGLAAPTTDEVKVLARIPPGTAASTTGSTPGFEIIASGADTFAIWTLPRALNPVDAELAFTVSNASTDVLFCANHGLEDGALLTVKSTTALPGGLSEGTVYKAVSTTSNSFKLALPNSTTPVDVVNTGNGVHTLKRESVYSPTSFTVANIGTDLLFADNHGLKDGYLVTVAQSGAGALPGGLSAGTIYRVMSAASDGFQLAVLGSADPVNILDAGTGTHELKRSDIWQTRTLRVNVDDPLAKDETSVDDLDYGDPLLSFARITNRFAGLTGLKDSATVETVIVNPLRLTAAQPVISGGSPEINDGDFFHVDFTVTNDASYATGSTFLRVLAPEGLVLRGGTFASGSSSPAPVLGEDVNGRQLLVFEIGSLDPDASRVCRVQYQVQYDWHLTNSPDPVAVQFATASINRPSQTEVRKVPYQATVKKRVRVKGRLVWRVKRVTRYRYVPANYVRNGVERELENPYQIDVLGSPAISKPQLQITGFEQFGLGPLLGFSADFTNLPEENRVLVPKIEMVADSAAAIPNSGSPARLSNELLFKVNFLNSGNEVSAFTRIKVKMPNNTTYVAGSASVRAPDGIVNPTPGVFNGYHYFTVPALSPGEWNTLYFRVKLDAGTPVGTLLFQSAPTIESRLMIENWPSYNALAAITVAPAAMDYQPQATQEGAETWYHEIQYQNLGGVAASGVGIRFYIPAGAKFKRAEYIDLLRNPVARGTRAVPVTPAVDATSGTVIFTIGSVPANGVGRVRVVLEQNLATLPERVFYKEQVESYWENYDSSTEPPGGPRRAKLLSLKDSIQFVVPTPTTVPDQPKPWIGIEGRRGAHIGETVTYQIVVGNAGGFTGQGFLVIPVPDGAELSSVVTSVEGGYRGGTNGDKLTLGPNTGFIGPGNITYSAILLDNLRGAVVYPLSLLNGGSVVVKFSVIMTGNEDSITYLRPTFHLNGNSRGGEYGTYRFSFSDPEERKRLKMYAAITGDAGVLARGSADQPNTIFNTAINQLSTTSRGVSIAGADYFQTPHGVVLVPSGPHIVAAGGGNLIGQDGASLIGQDGASVVSNDGAGFVVAGPSTTINLDIPNRGRLTADFVLRDAVQIVAAGGGNFIGTGVGTLIRPVFVLNGNDSFLKAQLIGQDGASLADIVQSSNGGFILERPGFPNLTVDQSSLAMLVRSAGLISDKGGAGIIGEHGAGIIGEHGAGIVAAGGGNIVMLDRMNYVQQGRIVAGGGGNIVAAGGGNIVAGGGGNIVAAGGGNLVQGSVGIVAGGGGNIVAGGGGN